MTSELSPFDRAAHDYLKAGWSPIPLPPRLKSPPPEGFTGKASERPNGDRVQGWIEDGRFKTKTSTMKVGNIGVRLAGDMLGLDVDHYDAKTGGDTIRRLEATLGPRPATLVSTSRTDGVSKIYFYRVPEGRNWIDDLDAVDTIHAGHRYAAVWPSTNPKTNAEYRWTDEATGEVLDGVPSLDRVAELPGPWRAYLDKGEQVAGDRHTLAEGDAEAILDAMPNGAACDHMHMAAGKALAPGSRHASYRGAVAAVVRYGRMGCPGTKAQLEALRGAFIAQLKDAPRDQGSEPPASEFARMVSSAVELVAGDPQGTGCPGVGKQDAGGKDGDKDGEKEPRKSVATELVELAQADYQFVLAATNDAYAVPLTGPKVCRRLRGGGLRNELALKYYETHGRAASSQAQTDALGVLGGQAQLADPVEFHVRVAKPDESIYLDLGDTSGRAVRIWRGGWEVVDTPPVYFSRSALTSPMVEPRHGGELSRLWDLINVSEQDRAMMIGWLLAALLPDIPHPVLSLEGEQGTGKTTATRLLGGLIDPSEPPVRRPPRSQEDWVVAATGSWVVAMDNISGISEWLSDAICRAVTGEGDVRRTLYTDGDHSVYRFRRVIVLNGIDYGAIRSDLAERLLAVKLERIDSGARQLDQAIAQRWQEARPFIVGSLLDLLAQVLAVLPGIDLATHSRMADFDRVLAALDKVTGANALERYLAHVAELATDSVFATVAIAELIEAVTVEFDGTSRELLELITPTSHDWKRPKGWPEGAQGVTGLLKRNAPGLRRAGWSVESRQDPHSKALRWNLIPPGRRPGETGAQAPAGHRPQGAQGQEPMPFAGVAGVADAENEPCHVVEAPEDVLTDSRCQLCGAYSNVSRDAYGKSLCKTCEAVA